MHGSANLKKVVKKARCTLVGTVGHVMLVIVYIWYCGLVAFHDINQSIRCGDNDSVILQVLYVRSTNIVLLCLAPVVLS